MTIVLLLSLPQQPQKISETNRANPNIINMRKVRVQFVNQLFYEPHLTKQSMYLHNSQGKLNSIAQIGIFFKFRDSFEFEIAYGEL